ncbi:class I SAM-dependent methyltransferase [Algoriphagus sp.]|uniref:O-methyltransferase n=1 Tax=Algoriphagus sp. TaxID=1872435 RepID=UPI00261C61EE|nr:class I SAM-dependent methyltransferase [Algoriphagus sp.]
MEFIDTNLLAYCEAHTSEEDGLLKKIVRETQAKVLMPRMLSGHLQGKFLEFLVNMYRPKTILEIGTYTGYSAVCMARGLAENGRLITLDKNDELEKMVRGFFMESGLAKKIEYRLGNALDLIPELEGEFDFVFIDADKKNNAAYYDLIIERMPSGGIILADNVLWSGKVIIQDGQKIDKDTAAILEFNRKVAQDPRVETCLLPLRDGLMMIRKR